MFRDFRIRSEAGLLGYRPLYHAQDVNHCPSCGGTHWLIGRSTAECAFCATALPLAAPSTRPADSLEFVSTTH